jgi:hypothetical protein
MKHPIQILSLLALFLTNSLTGDELRFKNGHLVTRHLISIRLTKDQVELLQGEIRPNFPIRLTESQRTVIRKVFNKAEPPSEIGVFRQSYLDGGCSCGLVNFGILYKSNILEIPVWSLCSDKEAEEFYGPADSPVQIIK